MRSHGPARALRRSLTVAAGLLAAAGGAPWPAAAHELGALQVRVVLAGTGLYRIEVAVDPEHLPPGIAPRGTTEGPPPAGDIALARRLAAAAELRFDGALATPRLVLESAPPAAAARLRFRLEGRLPAGAGELSWREGLPVGVYPFTVAAEEGDPGAQPGPVRWVEGGGEAVSVPLAGVVSPAPSRGRVAASYLALGFTHIVPGGLDHILFVLGLFLLARELRPLLIQVTAFTLAHSASLALAVSGLVRLPAAWVEPAIALSIAAVALENVFATRMRPWRPALVFVFGLLHGLGFAGVLAELGLPSGRFATALVAFNLGVEGGQLAVVGAAVVLVSRPWAHRPWYRRRIVVPASLVIALVGLYWTVERLGWS